MKKNCRTLYLFTVKLAQTLVSLLSVLLFSSFSSARKLSYKKGKGHEGRDCLILGNGPSLNNVIENNQDILGNFDLVAVNMFCKSNFFFDVKPEYYVLTDPSFFEDTKDTRIVNLQNEVLEKLRCVDWRMRLFIPFTSKKKTSKLKTNLSNVNISIVYYNTVPISSFVAIENFFYKKSLGMPLPMNVLCASIMIMINLGYKTIYIVGAEHSWLENFYIDDENNIVESDKHFYGEDKAIVPLHLDEWLYNIMVGFKSHRRISEYASYVNCKVYNCTRKSYIDSYERNYIFN